MRSVSYSLFLFLSWVLPFARISSVYLCAWFTCTQLKTLLLGSFPLASEVSKLAWTLTTIWFGLPVFSCPLRIHTRVHMRSHAHTLLAVVRSLVPTSVQSKVDAHLLSVQWMNEYHRRHSVFTLHVAVIAGTWSPTAWWK